MPRKPIRSRELRNVDSDVEPNLGYSLLLQGVSVPELKSAVAVVKDGPMLFSRELILILEGSGPVLERI